MGKMDDDALDWFDRLLERNTFDIVKIEVVEDWSKHACVGFLVDHINEMDLDHIIQSIKESATELQSDYAQWMSKIKQCTTQKMKQIGMETISISHSAWYSVGEYMHNFDELVERNTYAFDA